MRNWKTNLYILWVAQVVSLMGFGLGIPFIPYYIQELGVTDPDRLNVMTAILSAAPSLTMGLMAPVWGYFADKWGKKPMLLRAMFGGFIIITLMGTVSNVNQLILLRILQGVFTGTVAAAATLVASTTPKRHLSYALGVISSSTFIGNSAGPALGGFIAESVGYRVSFYIGGALLLLDFLMVMVFVREDKDPSIDADISLIDENTLDVDDNNGRIGSNWRVIFTPLIIVMFVVLFCLRVSRTVFNPYLPLYVQQLRGQIEGSSKITGLINSLIALATALSGLILSRLGDRYNKLNIIRVLLLCGIALSTPLFFTNTLVQMTTLLVIMFFAVGGIEPIVMSITSERTPSNKRGVLFGFQTLVGSIGWAIAPMLASYISINSSLKSTMILIPVFLGIGLLSTFILLIRKRNDIGTINELDA